MSQVVKKYEVEYDNKENKFIVKKKDKNANFDQTNDGLYRYDTSDKNG